MRIAETPVHEAPIAGPGAKRRDHFPDPQSWTRPLPPGELTGAETGALRQELLHGRGFAVLRGLSMDRLSEEEACGAYLAVGARLGRTLPQNVRGELLYAVRDEGQSIEKDYGRVGVRFSKTAEPLNFHTDSAPALMGVTPDIVGLLALEVAPSGGESALVSAYTVHNVMRQERPDLLARLYRSYHFDRRAEVLPGEPLTLQAPVFTYGESLHVRYFRFYIPQGHAIAGAPLGQPDEEALDYFEGVMRRAELQVRFAMRPGDIQFVNNRFVLHSRTAYQDEAPRRRHLKRLWLAAG